MVVDKSTSKAYPISSILKKRFWTRYLRVNNLAPDRGAGNEEYMRALKEKTPYGKILADLKPTTKEAS